MCTVEGFKSRVLGTCNDDLVYGSRFRNWVSTGKNKDYNKKLWKNWDLRDHGSEFRVKSLKFRVREFGVLGLLAYWRLGRRNELPGFFRVQGLRFMLARLIN